MVQILRLLNMRYAPSAVEHSAASLHLAGPLLTEVPEMVTGRLLATIAAATDRWGIGLEAIPHVVWRGEKPIEEWGSFPAEYVARLREESILYAQ